MLDDDAEPDRQWLHALLQPFADPQVACVGGSVTTSAVGSGVSVPRDSGRIRWYGKYVGGIGGDSQGTAIDVHGLQECNWAWRRTVLLGLRFAPVFNEDDGLHYGLDLCLQALAQGHRVVYMPAAKVVHHLAPRAVGARLEDKERRAFVAGRNLTFIGLKRYPPAQRVIFLLWWFGIGEGQSHGIARGLLHFCLHPTSGWPLVRSATRGRVQGLRWWINDGSHTQEPVAISIESHGT